MLVKFRVIVVLLPPGEQGGAPRRRTWLGCPPLQGGTCPLSSSRDGGDVFAATKDNFLNATVTAAEVEFYL